jgi:hypothetical protein
MSWDQWTWFIATGVATLAVAAVIWLRPHHGHLRVLRAERAARQHGPEIARIIERSEFTLGGTVAVLLLVLHQLGMLTFWIAPRVGQDGAMLAAAWIGGTLLWGVCALIGRRRTYAVYRVDPLREQEAK